MAIKNKTTHTAIWTPGWYELDQTLTLGERQKFWFFHDPPQAMIKDKLRPEFVFFNQMSSFANCEVRYARIEEMSHPKLGRLQRIDTDGLDYIFVPVIGPEVAVNAEEDPGYTYDSQLDIEDWTVFVSLSEVSEPVSEVH